MGNLNRPYPAHLRKIGSRFIVQYKPLNRGEMDDVDAIRRAYQDLFRKIEVEGIKRRSFFPGAVFVSASVRISEMPDLEAILIDKGYVYTVEEPSPLIESLDQLGFDSEGAFYKTVSEHWYLYHHWGVSKPE